MSAILQVPAVDLAAQWREIADEAEPLVLARLRSGNYLGQDAVEAFEAEFAAYVGGGVHAVACSSGTDAVELMVRSCTGENTEVNVPGETFVATWAAVERAGRRPTTHPQARARIGVWLYGSTAGAAQLRDECAEAGVPLLEDASQAHGNRTAGTFGVAAAWSLYPSKNLGGIGQGGVVTFRDSAAALRARRIREHGYDKATDRHWSRGFNLRMDGINAEVLRLKLRRLDAWVARKREIARMYLAGLGKLPITLPDYEPGHAWHQFALQVDNRDAVLAALRTVGIGAMVHYRQTADGRETEWSRRTLSLPCHAHLTDEQVEYVIAQVGKAVRG